MTSVEWLEGQFKIYLPSIHQKGLENAFEQAKQMHKQEIMTTYIVADSESTQENAEHNAEKYYEREFKKD
jgi:hypothetical protein